MTKEQLPMGWHIPDPLPVWLQDEGTSLNEWKTTANPRMPREMVACYVRGTRYVRVCKAQPEDDKKPIRYAVHIGLIADLKTDEIHSHSAELAHSIREAKVCMRLGGYT